MTLTILNRNYFLLTGYDSCARIWFGGDDLASPGNWVWASDLSSISNLNFIDGNDGHCIDVELCGNYQWHKVTCGGTDREHGFIAEKKGKF